ncbi:MAG: CHAT domain-containing protein [Pseudomonadota bacterium]|nr:CHAT domain-containing protein [Pseudomonadota bacterium]
MAATRKFRRATPLRLLRAVLVGLAAPGLAACEGAFPSADPNAAAGGEAAVCRKVDDALLRGQRNSFGLNFRAAEDAFAELLSLYALDDVAGQCPDAPSQAFVVMNQALAHSSQERFVTADGLFDRAASLLDGPEAGHPDHDRDAALLVAYRAQDQLNRSVLEGARAFVEQAASGLDDASGGVARFSFGPAGAGQGPAIGGGGLIESSGAEQLQVIEEASNQHTLAHVRLLEGDAEGAERAINTALDLIALVPRAAAAYRPRFLSQRALIKLERGDFEAARRDSAEAADAFAALMPDTPLEARARLREGRALVALGRADEALSTFERGFLVYEENPVVVEYGSLWPFFSLALNTVAQQPAREREMGERIFRAAQLVRQSITAQTVSGAAALLGEGDGDKARAVRAWRDANERYATLKALQVLQLRDPLSQADQARSLAESVSQAQTEVERLRAARDRIAPEYQSAIASPVTLDALQSVLGEGEALVQVLIGWPRSLILIIDRETVTYNAIPVTDSQVNVLIGLLRRGIETDRQGRVPEYRVDVAFQVFNLLFASQRERLMSFDRLIFSTSGALQSLPLELLATAPPDGRWRSGDYTSAPFLGAQKAVSYVPSPRNLVDIRARAGQSDATGAVASFADFRSGVNPDKVLRVSRLPQTCRRLAEAVDRVGELPGTAAEGEVIGDIFGADARLATAAAFNEDVVKQEGADGTLADYKVLHFATHGILWPTPDCFTDPALTVTATASEDSDGLLTASEIRLMTLDAQLVVLSACNTASGYLTTASNSINGARQAAGLSGAGGESLSGLARAFFAAGARAVLATHWPVADKETTALMGRFFRLIKDGDMDFATALRLSQAELRGRVETSHPVFWGPFVLIGDAAQTL